MADQNRNLNPHAEARLAMAIWGDEYAYKQTGGSMDFWDSRTDRQKALCVSIVDAVMKAAEENGRAGSPSVKECGTPSPPSQVVGIKPLEWKKAALRHSYGLVIRIGQTPFGAYHILKGSQGRFEVYFTTVPLSGAIDNEAEALAWAQHDYERRIRSALASAEVEG